MNPHGRGFIPRPFLFPRPRPRPRPINTVPASLGLLPEATVARAAADKRERSSSAPLTPWRGFAAPAGTSPVIPSERIEAKGGAECESSILDHRGPE
jgi:hypothetical protein